MFLLVNNLLKLSFTQFEDYLRKKYDYFVGCEVSTIYFQIIKVLIWKHVSGIQLNSQQ